MFDKLDIAKMHGLDASNVSCRDVMSQVEFELKSVLTINVSASYSRVIFYMLTSSCVYQYGSDD